MVLGCLGTRKAPFSQGVLVKFRERMSAHDLDRKLLARTIALAKARASSAGNACRPRWIRRRCSGPVALKTRGI
jgi:hypothetical protein